MPGTLNGIGTMNYGKCDFGPDGSFVTTTWFVLVYLPIIPLESIRIIEGNATSTSVLVASSSSEQYFVLRRMEAHGKQVFRTIAYCGGFVAIWVACVALGGVAGWLAGLFLVLIGLPYVCLPYFLREVARRLMWLRVAAILAHHNRQVEIAETTNGELGTPKPSDLTADVLIEKLYGDEIRRGQQEE